MRLALLLLSAGAALSAAPPAKLPYVYTHWKQFTEADGLPNDHIFAVKADGPRVWIGTENGLAMLDKRTGKIRTWNEKDGLPFRVVTALEVDKNTGDVWIGMFGGGLARFSGGRFDHWNQLNSGLVNDVVYGLAIEHNNVWAATTAGASRYNMETHEWSVFTEKNSPMEEIWNYAANYNDGKVYLGVWGSGILEYDVATARWKEYLDPDGEMEIDLYRDDGPVHVITTSVGYVDKILWQSTYFGASRYDGRHWRGYYNMDSGLPSDFINNLKARSGDEAWFTTDKGVGVITDFATNTWVTYTRDGAGHAGRAVVYRDREVLATVDTGLNIPHNFTISVDIDGNDVWIGTSKGLAWGMGDGYYPGLKERPAEVTQWKPEEPPPPGPLPKDSAEIARRSAAAGYYGTPDLRLRQEQNFAHTPVDVEPYGGVKPYKEHFLKQMEYTGPGRGIPEPADLKSVKIGFIGPIQPTVSVATGGQSHEEVLGTKMLQGARLAIEEANARGGYLKRKLPFELVISNDNGLWGSSGNEIVKLAYKDGVWAILGTIDGANSHIAIRVALKAELVVMNSGDTDPTYIETNIPWTMRCIGDDRQQNYILMDYMVRKMGFKRIAIIRASNRYGRFGVREIRDAARRLQRPVVVEMAYKVGSDDFALQLERVKASRPDVIVHWGDARESALILNQLRAMGVTVPYVASDRTVSGEFVKLAGKNAEGVIAAYPWDPGRKDPKLDAFRAAFRKRFNEEAETYAAHAYDGMNMLLDAIQNAGLNRARIRDVLAYRNDPWPGVTHDIPMGAALDDLAEVYLAKFENGTWSYYSREALGIPRGTIPRRDRLTRGGEEKTTSTAPYRDSRQEVRQYNGPDAAEPVRAGAVKIGFFGPYDPARPGSSLWMGAALAVEEANRAGGYQGQPFQLIPWWSDSPWKAGAPAVAKMAYDDHVVAVIGSVDGTSTHLAETVAAKAQLPLIDPGSTDKSVNYAGIPWMFSVAPSDDAQAAVIRGALAREAASGYVLVSATDHDSRALVASLKLAPKRHWEVQPDTATDAAAAEAAAIGLPVVVIANASDSGRFVRDLRAAGSKAIVFGGPSFGRREFSDAAGSAAGPVRYPGMLQASAGAGDFAARFRARYGFAPDYPAYYGYDAAAMTVASVRQAGLTRSGIRQALRQAEVWDGVSGLIEWNPSGRNSRAVTLISEGLH